MMLWATVVALVWWARWAAAAAADGGAVRLWTAGGTLEYAVQTAVLAKEAAQRDYDAGWLLAANLAVRALACDTQQHEALLHFQLSSVELLGRGAQPHAEWEGRPSRWAEAGRAPFYAHWRAGLVEPILDPAEPPHLADYKRGLLSLFQFQIMDGERNETDASGACAVLYETLSHSDFRKIKKWCAWEGSDGTEESWVTSRRVARYSLRAGLDAVSSIYADEVHSVGLRDAAVTARVWSRLTLQRDSGPAACPAALPSARARLPAHYRPATLAPPPPAPQEEAADSWQEWEGRWEEMPAGPLGVREAVRAATEADGEGEGEEARAVRLVRVYPVLRAAAAAPLQHALHLINDTDSLTRCMRVLGALGTEGAHAAAEAVLRLRAEPLGAPGAAYLRAAAAAPQPQPGAARALLALARLARCPRLRAAAALAGAAMASRSSEDVSAEARAQLSRGLARCGEGAEGEDGREACLQLHALALGNLRHADTAPALLALLDAGPPEVSAAAVRALAALPPTALPAARVLRLLAVAANSSRALDVRAAAADLAIERSAKIPNVLVDFIRTLHSENSSNTHEVRRIVWGRLHMLSEHYPAVRSLTDTVLRDPQLGSWHARAHAGTSSMLYRSAGWGAGGVSAALQSVQAAAGGLLRRGTVTLLLAPSVGDSLTPLYQELQPLLSVELWTRGLSALAGGGGGGAGEAGGEGEEAAGGLTLAVRGATLPPLTLFSSQAELLAHVWAGTGSEPAGLLRAALPLLERRTRLPTLAAPALLRAAAATELELDARASVSLWSRTASARLGLRAAAAAAASAHLAAPGAAAAVRVLSSAPAALSVAADLDFYDGVALCVRAALAPYRLRRRAAAASRLGARNWTVRRRRSLALPRPARTLALGPLNDRACRTLAAADL